MNATDLKKTYGYSVIGEQLKKILASDAATGDQFGTSIAVSDKKIVVGAPYEDTTARSDHASFQDNLGTVTVGFGGLVDGYWCYHQTCDTLDEMEEWMDTMGKGYGDENTGVANLVNSLDMITWWSLLTFFHCDESPLLNALN